MKFSKKIQAALSRRQSNHQDKMPSGQQAHKPGSQNRKKGASVKRSGRN